MHGCVHVIKHVLNVCVTEGPPGSWVWWAGGGGLLRRGLVGGSFSAISAGDTMKVTRQKDLIAPFLSLAIWGDFSLPLLQCV